jgi:hypothetical protein
LTRRPRRDPASVERARIRAAQAPALRNLRVLLMPECAIEDVHALAWCKGGWHQEDCPKGMFLGALRELRRATLRAK